MLISSSPGRLAIVSGACALTLLAAGCSSVSSVLSNDKVDYRTSGAKTVSLEVPPDLSQLSGQGRYAYASTGPVSASTFGQQTQADSAASTAVAPASLGGVTLQRDGQTRWLSVGQTPEQIWPLVRDFWVENGFELTVDQAQTGQMETNWNENRAKLKEDGLRNLVGRVFENLYDTGERDKFFTRIERSSKGTDIYIAHRGLTEEYVDANRKEQTTWKARPSDPELEARMLSRLMVKLGASKEAAATASANSQSTVAAQPAARVLADGVTVDVGGDFDQAWRRVGLALDRGGFTVEDRDRSSGTYEVRLASTVDANKPGLLTRMTGWFSSKPERDTLTRYRLKVASQGASSTVTVLGSDNKPAATEGGRGVAKQLSINLE
ncbi:MAG: outer membrane protein assembly factor BamC [Rubrivivax sp.]|nr:MAG: outer membrane protein assembly factor BamC [Rubrivivax sp.]